jgi:hypothetical protein
MTVARSVADVLADHVVFEVECIDRMYLNVYVPQLRYAAGLVGSCIGSWGCRSPRPRRWRRSVTLSPRRGAGSPTTRGAVRRFREGSA